MEDMAAIATAPAENPGANATRLAEQLGKNPDAGGLAVKKMLLAGGWYTEITWGTCACCGEPMATMKPGLGGPQKVHHRCRKAYWLRWEREQRANFTPEEAEAERAKHRDWSRAHQERQRARLSPEEYSAKIARQNASQRRAQAETKARAVNHGQPWSAENDRYILEDLSDPVKGVALALGRALEAVSVRKRMLQDKMATGGESTSITCHTTSKAL